MIEEGLCMEKVSNTFLQPDNPFLQVYSWELCIKLLFILRNLSINKRLSYSLDQNDFMEKGVLHF
jgi:hypothetical protein